MRIPDTLAALADHGIIDQVLRPLMSGKEAQIYLIVSDGQLRVAKVYKEAQNRTFKNRAEYVEGRKVRNSRDQRAMGKNSRHGRAQAEAAWRTTEVDMIYRLRAAGVRVPTPYHFIDGVLVMELVSDEHGEPAPRLGDVVLEPAAAQRVFDLLLTEVVRMLAAGVVHGDLSDFNVLMAPDGPVVIDFPQAVDASSNHNARKLLLRDVDNLHRFLERFLPDRVRLPYAQEMWALYERGELTPDTKLTGRYRPAERKVSTDAVLGLIGDATRDERRRRQQLGLSMKGVAGEDAGDGAAVSSAPKPISRYQQKRQAQVAATLAQKAAAAAVPAPRVAQRDPRAHAAHEQQRARPGSAQGRAHDANQGRAQGANQGRAQGPNQGRAHESQQMRSHDPHEPQRPRHAGSAGATRGHHGAREQQPRDMGPRASSTNAHPHAKSQPHARSSGATHATPQTRAAEGSGESSAQKRRRRRRGRKPGADKPSSPRPDGAR